MSLMWLFHFVVVNSSVSTMHTYMGRGRLHRRIRSQEAWVEGNGAGR